MICETLALLFLGRPNLVVKPLPSYFLKHFRTPLNLYGPVAAEQPYTLFTLLFLDQFQ